MELEKYKIRREIIKYLSKIIELHYSQNDRGHGIDHAEYVINRSLKFASIVESINYEMVYVIAGYHDAAHHIDAKNHEVESAKMLSRDKNLRKFFTLEQIQIMSEAVEDHRSSIKGEPRSIYGKIVLSADRNTSVETTLKRCYSYNSKHSRELNREDLIEKCRNFILEKFGVNGYARGKMYFEDKDYKKYLVDITKLASNKDEFYKEICKVNNVSE